ncbi:40S small subunit ribosomal protein eS21 (rpS21) [Andalucia godoyi]|uniref:40S ribosomal protein S21 n=1 Tax=Andalucia godoyi TaxID=505711 RepID=A0A8K0F221_ANDGO|nr:40S small subunit ribosomal protein eS21 (rpS21) [Andalucia godoyi]|eukprot:ANDGO_05053.mRNA.1 40S small subunit ribosomal protein eS21 (rpS21)
MADKGDLYTPRKCAATNRIITAKDHASVALIVGHVDESGLYTKKTNTFVLSGAVRSNGKSDTSLNRLAIEKGLARDI